MSSIPDIPTLGVNNLLLLYLDMIIYSYEKGSLTPCPGNEGVPAMSKTSWGSLFVQQLWVQAAEFTHCQDMNLCPSYE